MIVRTAGFVRHLITQPDHAALARRIMDFWIADGLPDAPRRASIFHAIAEHDNGWRDVDDAPIVDDATGAILDFISAPLDVRQSIWPRGVARLAGDPWAAALVAEHAVFIYGRLRKNHDWADFFTEMEALREQYVDAAGLTLEELQREYLFVRVADLMSLVFCNVWTDVQKMGHYEIRMRGDALIVSPDPFGGRTVPLEIDARELPARKWKTREAAAAFATAPRVTIRGVASG